MKETYLLYSQRGNGWMTKSSSYSSSKGEAKIVGRTEAMELCALHLSKGYTLIPVRFDDMQTVSRLAAAL